LCQPISGRDPSKTTERYIPKTFGTKLATPLAKNLKKSFLMAVLLTWVHYLSLILVF